MNIPPSASLNLSLISRWRKLVDLRRQKQTITFERNIYYQIKKERTKYDKIKNVHFLWTLGCSKSFKFLEDKKKTFLARPFGKKSFNFLENKNVYFRILFYFSLLRESLKSFSKNLFFFK